MAASTQTGSIGRLVLLVDEATREKFPVDTGVVFSSSDAPTRPKITTAYSLLGLAPKVVEGWWCLVPLEISQGKSHFSHLGGGLLCSV